MAEDAVALVTSAARSHPRLVAGGVVAGEPVTWFGDPDGEFQIGSVTKVFTALLLATYVVDGTLRLDAAVGELVPDLEGPVAEITLEQLATHTSGLPRVPRELWPRALGRHPDPYADLDHESLLRSLARLAPSPSRRPRYSNLGVGLLGHGLARWSGNDFDALLRERVTGPLGLTATGTVPRTGRPGHRRRGKPYAGAWTFDALAGAGALWSTLRDLQAFLAAQLDPPSGALGRAIRLTHEVRVAGGRTDQCLGWIRFHRGDEVLYWHNGGTAGYRAFVGLRPGNGAVAVLTASNRSVDAVGLRLARSLPPQPSEAGA